MLLTCAIYPLILLMTSPSATYLHALPPAVPARSFGQNVVHGTLRLLVVVPLTTASITWGVLPQIQRRFAG